MPLLKVLHVVGAYPTPTHPHNQAFIKTQIDSLTVAGIDCSVAVLAGRGWWKYAIGRAQIKTRLREGPFTLLHAHYSYCGLVSLGLGLPVVTSLLGNDLAGHTMADGSHSRFSRAVHIRLSRYVATRSAACIVKSQRMKTELGLDGVHVVPNGVDLHKFHPVSREMRTTIRQELGLSQDSIYLIFAGDPALPRKRFGLAQAAVNVASQTSGLALSLLPVHGQTQELVVKHMQACDMLILTSTLEGSPNVVKEAMAAGMAVVAVDVGDTRERLDGVPGCRVVNDDRPETVGAAIAEVLLGDEPMGGREAVTPLRIESVAAQIMEIYRRALAL